MGSKRKRNSKKQQPKKRVPDEPIPPPREVHHDGGEPSTNQLDGPRRLLSALFSLSPLYLVALALALLGWNYFETRDDPAMVLLMSGQGMSTRPSEFVLFINPLLTLPLKWLYSWWPDGPWYPLFKYLSLLFVFSYLGWEICRSYRPKWLLLPPLFIFVGTCFLIPLQFTYVAFFWGLIGLWVLWKIIDGRKLGKAELTLGIAAFFLCALVRYHFFFFFIAASGALLIFSWLVNKRPSKQSLQFMALATLLGLSTLGFFRFYYNHHPEWKSFLEFNQLSSRFFIEGGYDRSQLNQALHEANWKPIDYLTLHKWIFVDAERFNKERFNRFYSALDSKMFRLDPSHIPFMFRALVKDPRLYIILAFLLFCLLLVQWTRERWIEFSTLTLCLALAFVAVASSGRLVIRVYICLLALLPLWALFRSLSSPQSFPSWKKVLVGVFLGALVWQGFAMIQMARSHKAQRNQYAQVLDVMRGPFLYAGWYHQLDHIHPWESLPDQLRSIQIVPMGWANQSPYFHSMLKNNGIDNFFEGLITHNNFLLLAIPDQLAVLKKIYREIYGREVSLQIRGRTPFFNVVKVVAHTQKGPATQ